MRENRSSRSSPAHRPRATRNPPEGAGFPIVGVGASAGGLEAFTELLKHLPADTGMAFVLVQHLDPHQESALTELLARTTTLPVRETTNNLRVEADCVYVISPNAGLSIAGGVLQLQPRPKTRAPHRSIDAFFESLAQDQRERSIGVVLSGSATDGTLGLEAIKAEGGITFAQDDSARFDSMPQSAIAAGCVDFVLSPRAIAAELASIAKHPYVARRLDQDVGPERDRAIATAHADDATPLPAGNRSRPGRPNEAHETWGEAGSNAFKPVLRLLHDHSGVDFSLYKSGTIQRRVTRRMVLVRETSLSRYATFLKGNIAELDALYSDVLIGVTSFFRNAEAFDVLRDRIFSPALKQRGRTDAFRVWTLGCSTGQEAYSIAMAFAEAADRTSRAPKLQVFATDLNESLLDKARRGLYAKSIADAVSPARLQRFFVEENGGYRVIKSLREMVVFARQNIITDPPFSRLDLISCRNVLIYFDAALQQKALATFHYALRPHGHLFLGASETTGASASLFEPVDRKHKIYAKKAVLTPALHFPLGGVRDRRSAPKQATDRFRFPQSNGSDDDRAKIGAQHEADRITVNQIAPPSVLVNAELQILQFRGPTGAFFEPGPGKASLDVLKMAREGLRLPLRALLAKAKKDNKRARKERVHVSQNGVARTVNVEVIPLKNVQGRCFLILFEKVQSEPSRSDASPHLRPTGARGKPKAARARKPQTLSARETELEHDLAETRDYLQSILEQSETAQEGLQASHEEAQSANEELQSINEELETSKEELQSTNEELMTLNEEMVNRNQQLNGLNNDLINQQASAKLAIVLLGRDLTIRRFSPQAAGHFNLRATDIGRPIGNMRARLVFGSTADARDDAAPLPLPPVDLEKIAAEVISSMRELEFTVRDDSECWYSLRVRPYVTEDNRVDGAVVVLVDIDALKRGEQAVAAARDYAEAIVRTARDPLIVLDADLRVETANDAFYRVFRTTPADAQGRRIYDLGHGQWNIPRLRVLLEEIIPQDLTFDDFEVTHDFADIGRRTMLLNARAVTGPGGARNTRILLGIEDATEMLQARTSARESAARYKLLFDRSPIAKWTFKRDTHRFHDVNDAAVALYGYSREEFLGMRLKDLVPAEDRGQQQEDAARPSASTPGFEARRHRKRNGELIDVEIRTSDLDTEKDGLALAVVTDVTARTRAEQALRHSDARFKALFESAPIGVYMVNAALKIVEVNPKARPAFGEIDDLMGRDFVEVMHVLWPQDVAEQLANRFRHTLATGESYRTEEFSAMRIDRQASETYEWEIHRIPLPDGQYGVVCSFSDIAERAQLKKELESRVKDSATADRLKTEFLALLAHELRNPLAPIRNMLEVLKKTDATGALISQARETMDRQLAQMTHIIDDLLDVSRISRGKLDLRLQPLELSSVLFHAVEAAREAMDSARHEFTVDLSPEPMYLNADHTRLAQAVGNLLTNACKYTDSGGRIALTLERSDGDAVIRVRDSGIGIASDKIAVIFDMFIQVDSSLDRSVSGLGLGLTLVKTLVEMHGGTVEAHSAGLGQGSEFVIRLPLSSKPSPSPPAELPPPSNTIARRILVVDDNRDSASSLSLLLRLSGHETSAVHDGIAAVEAAETIRPEVILMDIGLPKMNGYEAARRIREQPWGKRMVLVAVSGYGQAQDRRRSQEAGFDTHMVKPVDIDVLSRFLADAVPSVVES